MENLSFTAIDFETMTSARTSACAVGLVRVENSVIVSKYYTLFKPITDDKTKTNSDINGITREMVENLPDFGQLWPKLQEFLDVKTLVAHNAKFDMDVLSHLCSHYRLNLHVESTLDTMAIADKSLEDTCADFGISVDSHHDALCDATACAEVLLRYKGIVLPQRGDRKRGAFGKKRISRDAVLPLDLDQVKDKDTIFFDKKVVLTGDLKTFASRQQIADILKGFGADINLSISKRTDIVVVGEKPGPSKMQQIFELGRSGHRIRIVEEPELLQILKEHNVMI